ncbi:MAG TPA: hypothetical protein VK901_20195 [Nitrospiraceae bacterium]|nr:hypothetical protein [Nitrospiraceae bacterium]
MQLQRQLGILSDTTDWYMLHRLRKGMVNESAKHKRGRGVTAAKPKDLGHWYCGGPPLSTPGAVLKPL